MSASHSSIRATARSRAVISLGAGPHAGAVQTTPGPRVLDPARAPETQKCSPRAQTARGEQRRIYSPPTASGTGVHTGESLQKTGPGAASVVWVAGRIPALPALVPPLTPRPSR